MTEVGASTDLEIVVANAVESLFTAVTRSANCIEALGRSCTYAEVVLVVLADEPVAIRRPWPRRPWSIIIPSRRRRREEEAEEEAATLQTTSCQGWRPGKATYKLVRTAVSFAMPLKPRPNATRSCVRPPGFNGGGGDAGGRRGGGGEGGGGEGGGKGGGEGGGGDGGGVGGGEGGGGEGGGEGGGGRADRTRRTL